jgi:glycosyltransferase involved in cell wall biosynthesis
MSRIWVDVEEQAHRLAALGVPLPPIDVVRNTPTIDRIASPPVPRPRTDGLLLEMAYLGILELQRGVSELLNATAILRDRGSPIRLVIVGGGRDEAIFKAQADQLGLSKELVEFAGFLPHEQALARVAAADVGTNPIHRNEKHDTTLPNKLFDYMAAGLPVLTSDSTPSARVVHATGCGEVFRSGDAADAVRAILELALPEQRAAMGCRGQAAIRDEFHWERDAERLLAGVDATMRTRPPGPDAH